MEEKREEVKPSCFFDKRVKPRNLEKVKPFREKNTMEKNEAEKHSIKKNKEEQIRRALRLERYARLDKMENLSSGHTLRLKG